MKKLVFIIFTAAAIVTSVSFASSFKLDSGETFNGILKELNKTFIIISNSYGEFRLPREKIKSMDFSGETISYVIYNADGTKIQANLISFEDGFITINTSGGIINMDFNSIENIYNLDYKIAKDKEELEKLKNSFNELKLFFGYGFITGDFKDYYKNNFIFGASYSMFVYPSIARLGIDIRYQAVKAKEVATTKMTNYTFTPFLKIGYFFFSNDFLSNLYFYIRVGYGQNLTVLAVDSNEDVGLDSEYFAGFGVDYYLEKIICFIEGEYFVINGKEKKFKEIKVLSGFGLRF